MEAIANKTTKDANRQIISHRIIKATPEVVFMAFTNPHLLAQWWGPNGFTNTFETFDLRPGGQWKFIMHGPNGTDYPNRSEFVDIKEPEKIVFNHVVDPLFQMTIGFEAVEGGTRFSFHMLFETEADCERVKRYAPDANEQNFDRPEAVLQKNK